MATSKKPVTVWVAEHIDGSLCDSSPRRRRVEVNKCPYDHKRRIRRFVAIDSLPAKLREKVRKLCRREAA